MTLRKPDTKTAMRALLSEIRHQFPFDMPQAQLCRGPCTGCPKKLLEFLDTEVENWDAELNRGRSPSLGDISRMARRARKIHALLVRNDLVQSPPDPMGDSSTKV